MVNNIFKKLLSIASSPKPSNWIQRFIASPRQYRFQMVKKPVIIITALFLLINFGPLFIPPKILTSFPGNKSAEAPLDSRIEVIFDKGVIKSLAEKSFSISPNISGKITWESNQKLIFTPSTKLERGKQYVVTLNGIVLSNFLVPLLGNKTILFETIGDPKVSVASPLNEAPEDLTPVTVVFDRAMIPLTTATNSAELKSAFTITPDIKGSGKWLGTTAYQFRPEESFKKGTTYTVAVTTGISSQDGGKLQNEYTWQFSGLRPHANALSPISGYNYANPIASVSATFNQNIDSQSISDKFSVYDINNIKIPGKVIVTKNIAGFYPDTPLKRKQQYSAVIDSGVEGVEGPNGMEANYSWGFGTAASPSIISTIPANGELNVSEQYHILVNFKTPMDENSFKGNVTIDPPSATNPTLNFSSYNDQNNLSINTYLSRSKQYKITIGANVKDQYGTPLNSPYSFTFTTAPFKPSLSIYPFGTFFGSFNQQLIPRIVSQVINTNHIDYSLYKLQKEDVLDLYRRRYEQQCGQDYSCSNWQNYDSSKLTKVNSWTQDFQAEKDIPTQVVTKVTNSNGENLPSGFYLLNLKIPQGSHDNMVMIVSKSTITVKKSNSQIFSWVVDQSTGGTISNMNMSLMDDHGNILSTGITNKDGVFMKDVDLFQKDNLFVLGQSSNDVVLAASAWKNGIDIYDFGLPSYYSANYSANEEKDLNTKQGYKTYLVLDRPIFRPGQKAYFKGVIRKDNDGAYENIPAGEKIKVTITDAMSRAVYSQDLPLTTFGSFASEFSLGKDANLGYYQLSAKYLGNNATQSFQVEEYKKPEMAVSVNSSKTDYVAGEKADITMNAAYYFGAPLTDAPLSYSVATADYTFQWNKDWRFEFGDPDAYWDHPWWYYSGQGYSSQKVITSGKTVTDSKGNVVIQLPLDISKQKTSQKMIVEAVVSDINNQSSAASKDFIVHKAGIYAGVHSANYANQSGTPSTVDIVTVDTKGQEIPNTSVSVTFYKRTWEEVREKNPDDGNFYYVSKPTDTEVAKTDVTTDAKGYGNASFTPKEGGTYKAVVTVTDKNGNKNISGSFLWVQGAGFQSPRQNNDRIIISTDKPNYFVGDTLSLFVATPFASDSAKTLLTSERGSVLDYKVVETSDVSNNFKMAITSKYSPNAFIGAVLVKPGSQVNNPSEFKIGYTPIKVTDKSKQINVSISTDKQRYKPKDKLNATIETKDATGNPVSSEVAVGLVDKAVWDLAQVQLPDIYKVFYQPRNLEVTTSQLLTISIDRINANLNLGAKGGSGGGGGGGGFNTSRSNFPDTAYWNPNVKTDASGKAQISIQLPDNLTTWRLAAIANSPLAAFGSTTKEVVVNKDVLIRPFLPRFLSVGDQAIIGAIVANTSGKDQTITTKIEGTGIQITDNPIKQQVLADGQQTKIIWPTITKDATDALIKLSVTDENNILLDSVETKLPVKSYSVPEVVATSGQAKDTAEEIISLPKDIDKTQGQTMLTFAPSLGSASINSLSYLFSYPYNCIEQITSKFMPAVFVNRIFKNSKIQSDGDIKSVELQSMVSNGVQVLNNQQHSDGGWGWFSEYDSDPYISAYGLSGLLQAKKDGFTVPDQTIQRAKDYLKNQLAYNGIKVGLNTQAYILYVLSDNNQSLSSYGANLFEHRFELSIEARAYLALAMKNFSGMGSNANKIYNELLSLSKLTSTTAHFEDSNKDYRLMSTNTTTTAVMLEAMVNFDNKSPLIPQVIRYLMSIRSDGHWNSTRETASVIKAISSQLLSSDDTNVNENYQILLNGQKLQQGSFTKTDLLKVVNYIIPIQNLPVGEKNKLTITKSGQGSLYYNMILKYFLPFSTIKPIDLGMTIIREFVNDKGGVLPINKIDEGTQTWVRLIVVVPAQRHFVTIEDVLPAGLESVNESLKNVSVLNKQNPTLKSKADNFHYFDHKEYHDDRTTLFASDLPAGVYEFTYRVRATTPGIYHYPPAQAYELYNPDISGHSAGGWLEVTPQ